MDYLIQNIIQYDSLIDISLIDFMAIMLVGGLLGSFTHCSGMCGPFIVSQTASPPRPSDQKSSIPMSIKRASGWALLPYHLGRMVTYIALGVAATMFSAIIIKGEGQQMIAGLLLSLAGFLFIYHAWPRKKARISIKAVSALSAKFGQIIGKISAPFSQKKTAWHSFFFGALLGFMPCGFLYAAIMAVASSGDPKMAALGMVSFTLGTMPSLISIGLGGRLLFRRWPTSMQFVARTFMTLNGISLFALGGGMLF